MDQTGRVTNPYRGQLNRENEYGIFPCPRSRLRIWSRETGSAVAPENLVSRDEFDSPVPRQPAHLHTQAESAAFLRGSSRFPRRRPFIDSNRHTPSGQSRVHWITQLRTDSVHCRESAITGPVNLKVVPNGCCLGRSP